MVSNAQKLVEALNERTQKLFRVRTRKKTNYYQYACRHVNREKQTFADVEAYQHTKSKAQKERVESETNIKHISTQPHKQTERIRKNT